jgi:uncharacterized membrane protein YhfC
LDTLVTTAGTLSSLAMIALPLVAGAIVAQRRLATWRPFGLGMLSFVLSQVVHLPMLWAIRQAVDVTRPRLSSAIVLGAAAGICEETARLLVMRRAWRDVGRAWGARMFGLGHGGIEAMIFGLLAFATAVAMPALHGSDLSLMPKDGSTATRNAVEAYFATPAWMGLVGLLERCSAIAAHVGMTMIVVRGVRYPRAAWAWLGLAVICHATLDGGAVFILRSGLGVGAVEAWTAAWGVALAVAAWKLGWPDPAPPPPLAPVTLVRRDAPPSAAALDSSRFD